VTPKVPQLPSAGCDTRDSGLWIEKQLSWICVWRHFGPR